MAYDPTASPRSAPSSPVSVSGRTSRSRSQLSLDMSCIPPLSHPTPPSNTLLMTELHDLKIFQPASLDAIRTAIGAVAPLFSFSPLPSMRRIVCSFFSADAAVLVRQMIENGSLFNGSFTTKVYFGEPTLVEDAEAARKRKLLEAPHAEKMFFISPPPSPPHGWTMRNEDPPNKDVHASDLAEALARLGTVMGIGSQHVNDLDSPASLPDAAPVKEHNPSGTSATPPIARQRSRSSTLIYRPEDHGHSPNLPAVMVVDTSFSDSDSDGDVDMDMDFSPIDSTKKIMAHTARPPVELME